MINLNDNMLFFADNLEDLNEISVNKIENENKKLK